jgi:flagellar motor switch protein FliM
MVTFAVEMGHAAITLKELLHLVPGDTIMLDKDIRSDLLVTVGGINKFLGTPGVQRGNKAVQITRCTNREV